MHNIFRAKSVEVAGLATEGQVSGFADSVPDAREIIKKIQNQGLDGNVGFESYVSRTCIDRHAATQ